jgi:hypothetical protein
VFLAGSTVDAGNDVDTCFGGAPDDGADWIIPVTLEADGVLRLEVDNGEALNGTLSVQAACETTTTVTDYCYPTGAAGDVRRHAQHAVAGTYYVVIDTVGDTEDTFTLTASATTAACGDAVVSPGEDCDPGAGVPGDGCFDPGDEGECTFEPPPENLDVCPGEGVEIEPGLTRLSAADGYSTDGFIDDYEGSCFLEVGGLDRVFMITPSASGMLDVSIGYEEDGQVVCDLDVTDPRCWDQMLYARSTCDDEGVSELACSHDGDGAQDISMLVDAGVPVYVFVDGYDAEDYSRGPFDLDLVLTEL